MSLKNWKYGDADTIENGSHFVKVCIACVPHLEKRKDKSMSEGWLREHLCYSCLTRVINVGRAR